MDLLHNWFVVDVGFKVLKWFVFILSYSSLNAVKAHGQQSLGRSQSGFYWWRGVNRSDVCRPCAPSSSSKKAFRSERITDVILLAVHVAHCYATLPLRHCANKKFLQLFHNGYCSKDVIHTQKEDLWWAFFAFRTRPLTSVCCIRAAKHEVIKLTFLQKQNVSTTVSELFLFFFMSLQRLFFFAFRKKVDKWILLEMLSISNHSCILLYLWAIANSSCNG